MTWLSLTFIFVLVQTSGASRSSMSLNYDDSVESSLEEATVYVVFDGQKLQIKTGSVSSYVAKAFLKNTMNSTG